MFEFKHVEASRISTRLEDFVERIHERDEAVHKRMSDLIADREKRLAESITHVREMMLLEITSREAAIEKVMGDRVGPLSMEMKQVKEVNDDLEKRLSQLEKWVWVAMGAVAVVSFLIQNVASFI